MGFWISSPARYAYHSLKGEGSVMGDYHSHKQNLLQLQSYGEGLLQKTFPGNQNSLVFQSFGTMSETALGVSTLAGLGRAAIQKGFSWMSIRAESYSYSKTAELVKSKNFELNRFDQAAQNLSETGQNNIRILRNWAKSKGWEKMPNSKGGPEKWGVIQNGNFEWRLVIKPEASMRPGLESGSQMPRFDARLMTDITGKSYINPFTRDTGNWQIGTHIPLEHK